MKQWFAEDGPGPRPTELNDAQRWLALLSGLGFAVAILAAALAGAEEPVRVAPPGDAEPRAAASDAAAKPDSSFRPEIEEFIVLGAESEATMDFGAADSVTGFGAEDLAALGAQDIADLAAFTPNLEIVTSGATTPTFFIRGVGLNDFNSNSTGAVAIYRDDVAINAPALQLLPLFDVEAVNVLRGPQGTGLARNASAGAIKMYSRKPTGEYGAFLRSDSGNFDFRDFEGAIEAPIFEDVLAGRFAFRFSERDGTMKNRCGNAKPFEERTPVPSPGQRADQPPEENLQDLGLLSTYTGGSEYPDPYIKPDGTPAEPGELVEPWSICSEPVTFVADTITKEPVGVSAVPEGLAPRVNDIGNWAARGTLLFQPTLDMSWLLSAHGSRRDELSRLGQSYGTNGFSCDPSAVVPKIDPMTGEPEIDPETGEPITIPATENCSYAGQTDLCVAPAANVGKPCLADANCDSAGGAADGRCTSRIVGVLGGPQGTGGYMAPEVLARLAQLADCYIGEPGKPAGTDCDKAPNNDPSIRESSDAAKRAVAEELARGLDSKPWEGDFNRTGPTRNDTWGGYLKGDIVLPLGMQLTSVTGYDTYDRVLDIDLDFSPETLFHIVTDDDGWQVTQDLRLQGQLGDDSWLRWDIGGWFLREQLNVVVTNDLGDTSFATVGERDYTQDLWSAAGYASLAFDFWDDFRLDGGFRYNWERKKLDYSLTHSSVEEPLLQQLDEIWDAPTGTVRLTYRFREDTHVFWKYTRGWKPGTYNATSALLKDFSTQEVAPNISIADPETIDSFETGVRGSWFEGRVGLDLGLFYYAYQDYQIFIAKQLALSPPEFVIINADDAEVYGAEVDAVVRPWSGAFVNVRFGWIESQFLDFVQLQQETVNQKDAEGIVKQVTVNRELQNTGNSLLNSPRFKVSLTAEQTLPLGRFGSVTARYDGVWTDTTFYDATAGRGIQNVQNLQFLPEGTIAQRAYWLHNLRLSYRPPGTRLEIASWVRNLTNEAYKPFAFDASTFNNTSIYFVGDPRTYGGSLVINF